MPHTCSMEALEVGLAVAQIVVHLQQQAAAQQPQAQRQERRNNQPVKCQPQHQAANRCTQVM